MASTYPKRCFSRFPAYAACLLSFRGPVTSASTFFCLEQVNEASASRCTAPDFCHPERSSTIQVAPGSCCTVEGSLPSWRILRWPMSPNVCYCAIGSFTADKHNLNPATVPTEIPDLAYAPLCPLWLKHCSRLPLARAGNQHEDSNTTDHEVAAHGRGSISQPREIPHAEGWTQSLFRNRHENRNYNHLGRFSNASGKSFSAAAAATASMSHGLADNQVLPRSPVLHCLSAS